MTQTGFERSFRNLAAERQRSMTSDNNCALKKLQGFDVLRYHSPLRKINNDSDEILEILEINVQNLSTYRDTVLH